MGFLQERFFDIVSAENTCSSTLKKKLSNIFSHHALNVENLRGQGYDGASNMHGEWNGLQALFFKDCPYAYYVHCFAHRLQLALVAASRDVILVHQFFSKLDLIVNIVGASCKRNGDLITAQQAEISRLISIDELGTGSEANQIGNLQRAGNTRWGSYFSSVCSLIKMFRATGTVLQNIVTDGANYSQRGDADSAYTTMTSFQLNHYHLDMTKHEDLCHLSTLTALCEGLTSTKKASVYFLVDRLIRLILLLPVSTATTERVFSVMKLTKTRLQNKMNDEFLGDCMLLHIEREITDTFSTDSIIDEFYSLKHRKAQL